MANKCSVIQQADRVLLISNGKLVLDMPYQAARQLAQGMIFKANEAEQFANIEQTITDGAILHRAGATIGLTNNKKAKKEILKTALYERDLRRFMANGIKSGEVFGTPTILNKGPKQ